MCGLLLLAGWVLAAPAEAPADEALKADVQRLVRQLDAPQLARREEAEAALLKLGPRVLDLLPPASDRMPAEVKQRLQRVQQQLRRQVADSAAAASLITLSDASMPLGKVLAALEQQSGNRIVDLRKRFGHPLSDPEVKATFDQTPFWQALDRVLDQAGLTVYDYGEQRAIHVVGRGETQLPRSGAACYNGPWRFELTEVTAQRDLRSADGQSLRLGLEVAWEPRLKPISIKQRLDELRAVDENDDPLTVDARKAELEVPVAADATAVKLVLPFRLPPRDVKEIASLRGALLALLPGKIETFRFEDLPAAKNVEKRLAGVTVVLDQVQKNNEIWQVRMRVRFDEPEKALESHRGWIFQNEAYLEAPDGKPIAYEGFETTRQTGNEVGIAYSFVLDGPPAKHTFVYKTPGVIVAKTFDYRLKSVRLP